MVSYYTSIVVVAETYIPHPYPHVQPMEGVEMSDVPAVYASPSDG